MNANRKSLGLIRSAFLVQPSCGKYGTLPP
jgi:hypothetical protein